MKENYYFSNSYKNTYNIIRQLYLKYKYEIYIIAVSLLAFVLRARLASTLNLGNDEAHYYVWSLKPSLGYLDDAPMVGWVIRLFTEIFGTSQLSVRLEALVFSFLDGFAIYYLSLLLFKNRRAAFFSFIFFTAEIIFGTVLSVMVLPDSPLLFFSLCFLAFFYLAVSDGKRFLWVLAGISLGLAFLSKYTAALIPPSALLYLIISGKNRKFLKTAWPYVSLGIAVLVFLPVVYWNWRHNFISFKFQLSHGFSHPKPGLPLFAAGWSGQFLVVTPFIYLFLVGAFLHSFKYLKKQQSAGAASRPADYKKYRFHEEFLFSACLSIPILAFFIVDGYSHRILLHWPDIGYLSAFPLMGYVADEVTDKAASYPRYIGRFLKFYVYFSIFSGFLLFSVLYGQICYHFIPVARIIRYIDRQKTLDKSGIFSIIPNIPGNPATADVTNDLFGWNRGAAGVRTALKKYEKKYPGMFVLTHHYAVADELVFYGDFRPAANIYNISGFLNQYDIWQDLNKINGRNALFVMDSKFMTNPNRAYKKYFKSIAAIESFAVCVKGRPVRKYYLYLMKDFDAAAAERRLLSESRMY